MFRMVLNSNDVTRLFYKIIFTVQVNTDHVLRLFLKGGGESSTFFHPMPKAGLPHSHHIFNIVKTFTLQNKSNLFI